MWNSTMSLLEKRYLHHCSLRSKKDQRTWDKLITLMKKVCCQLSPCLSVIQERWDPCMNLVRKVHAAEKNRVATQKMSESGFSLNDKSKFSLILRAEIHKHEFQADCDRRSIQELNGIIESQRREIDHTLACDEQLRRDQQLLHKQLSEQNRDLREAHMKSFMMGELKRFQGYTFDEFSRRRLIEDRDTILELTAKIQELQNEVNWINDSRDFKDAESVRSGQSHVTSQPAFFPLFLDPGGMQSRSMGMLSRNDKPPSIGDTLSPFSHVQVRWDPCTNQVQICLKKRKSSRDLVNEWQNEQILAEARTSLQKSHVLKVEELSRRKLTEDQNTMMELRAKFQELQNVVNCMKCQEILRMRVSTQWTIPLSSQPPFRDPGNNQPPDIGNSQGISGNVFANPRASSSSPYPGGFNPWISNVTETRYMWWTSDARHSLDSAFDP